MKAGYKSESAFCRVVECPLIVISTEEVKGQGVLGEDWDKEVDGRSKLIENSTYLAN